jgi:hypothetical protein
MALLALALSAVFLTAVGPSLRSLADCSSSSCVEEVQGER